jgi:tetratricopeptide (TPR) repeat protein
MLSNAVMALRMQQPREAERLASEVLKSDSDDIAAAGILGRALLIQNRAAEAMIVLERAAQRAADPEIETLLALALSAIGRGEEALAQLRKAAARQPAYPPAFLKRPACSRGKDASRRQWRCSKADLRLCPARSNCVWSSASSISSATTAKGRAP